MLDTAGLRGNHIGDMRFIRNRARLVAAIALMWHVVAVAAVSTTLSCGFGSASDHAAMENCPLHASVPACPLHAEKHGTHECDCPTIGCAETDTGFMALFGAIGILPVANHTPIPLDAGAASVQAAVSTNRLPTLPLSPPPRA